MSEAEVALRAGHEECLRLMNPVEAGKIDAGPAHDVDGTSFEGEFVEDINVVNLAGSNVNDTWRAKSA